MHIDLRIPSVDLAYHDCQVLDMCQLGDEVKSKEGKLDSAG